MCYNESKNDANHTHNPAHKGITVDKQRHHTNGNDASHEEQQDVLRQIGQTPQADDIMTNSEDQAAERRYREADALTLASVQGDSNGHTLHKEWIPDPQHPGHGYYRIHYSPKRSREPGNPDEPQATVADLPRGGLFTQIKHALIGSPIPSERAIHERIGKAKALALLSSDALSSVAYGTEASLPFC